MKKLFLAILILSLLFATLAPFGVSVFADEVEATLAERSWSPAGKDYTLTSIPQQSNDYTKSKAPVGVSFQKMYFGSSGIPVSLTLYSDPSGFGDLGFWIGDTANLDDKQLATRNKLVEFFDWVDATINEVDVVANTQYNGEGNLPHSDINKYNQASQGTKLQVDYHTYKMLAIGREMYDLTSHAFNPAIYRLVDLWGFSSRTYSYKDESLPYDRKWDFFDLDMMTGNILFSYPLPDQKYVTAFSTPAFTDFSQSAVTLTEENGNYFVTKNVAPVVVDGVSYEQWLDLGGIAKGYVVDLIKQELSKIGQTRYYVDAGTSSQNYGYARDGENWKLLPPNSLGRLEPIVGFEVPNRAVSTSGQYNRKYITNGVEYAHIIDGMRGAPAQTGIKSITITVPDDDGSEFWACKADCLSTAMTVLGRDGIVDFCNSEFFAQNDVDIFVLHEAIDGSKQILSNMDEGEMVYKAPSLSEFSWNLKNDNGVWVYDGKAQLIELPQTDYTWILIVLAVVVVALFAIVVLARYTAHKQKGAQNIHQAKRDNFFKPADVMVYLAVVLVILVLFSVFFGESDKAYKSISIVNVVDLQTGQTLFVYNVGRNEYQIAESSPWDITVTTNGNDIIVHMTCQMDGEERFNEITITKGTSPKVKMTDSVCGFSQDCVRYFGAMTTAGQSIVCSPNYLKVISD